MRRYLWKQNLGCLCCFPFPRTLAPPLFSSVFHVPFVMPSSYPQTLWLSLILIPLSEQGAFLSLTDIYLVPGGVSLPLFASHKCQQLALWRQDGETAARMGWRFQGFEGRLGQFTPLMIIWSMCTLKHMSLPHRIFSVKLLGFANVHTLVTWSSFLSTSSSI